MLWKQIYYGYQRALDNTNYDMCWSYLYSNNIAYTIMIKNDDKARGRHQVITVCWKKNASVLYQT